jgi:hypothetical protein
VHQALEGIFLHHHSAAFARLGFNDLGALLARSEAGTLGEVAAAVGMGPADGHKLQTWFGAAAKAVVEASAVAGAQSGA